jgi:hypothetical protein
VLISFRGKQKAVAIVSDVLVALQLTGGGSARAGLLPAVKRAKVEGFSPCSRACRARSSV